MASETSEASGASGASGASETSGAIRLVVAVGASNAIRAYSGS